MSSIPQLVPPLAPSPPPLRHSVMELGRVFLEMGSAALLGPLARTLPRGDGHSVMTLPGFMGADGSTALLRRFLNDRGYNAVPWGLGRNASDVRSQDIDDFLDHRTQTEAQIADHVEQEFKASGRKVTLVGWSLGGLYAVAVAHKHPQWVRQVITLGTPFGDPRGTAIYSVMQSLYDNEVDAAALERWIGHTYSGGKLRVPILALYSETDGVVGSSAALCQGDPRYVTNMAVMASHVGFPFNPLVFAVIANHLVEPHERWALCKSEMLKPFVELRRPA